MTSSSPPSLLPHRLKRWKIRRPPLLALTLLAALALATMASATSEITKLTGNAGENADFFGSDVSLDGNLLALGLSSGRRRPNRPRCGLRLPPGGAIWFESTKLAASDPGKRDYLGEVIATNGTLVAAGSNSENVPEGESGAVYTGTIGDVSDADLVYMPIVTNR